MSTVKALRSQTGASTPFHSSAVPPGANLASEGALTRCSCLPRLSLWFRSLALRPPPRNVREIRDRAANRRQPSRSFPLHQRLQCLSDQSRFFFYAGVLLG